jgi:hypothetical protein
MTQRNTKTEKWTEDAWFKKLKAFEKLMFIFLCDNCDCAGIWEIDFEDAAYKMGMNIEIVEQAFRNISKCYVTDGKKIMLINFLYHQNNLPLNPDNNAHKGIIKRLGRHPGLWELAKEKWHEKSYIIHKAQRRLF